MKKAGEASGERTASRSRAGRSASTVFMLLLGLAASCSAGGSGSSGEGEGGIQLGDCGPGGCFEPAADCEDGEASFTIRNLGPEGLHLVGGSELMSLPTPQISSGTSPAVCPKKISGSSS